MSTYLYIRAVPLIAKGYTRVCQALFKENKGLVYTWITGLYTH